MKARHPSSAWPRNNSAGAKALVLIDFVLRHQVAFAVGGLLVTAVFKGVVL